MTDWAAEIASKLTAGIAHTFNGRFAAIDLDELAIAIRKAKADGYREAAELILFRADLGTSDYDAIRAAADKIEQGQEGME